MTPLETAVYWCEYVIRHGGAPHLRSSAMDLNFVQYHNLDAILILSILALVSSYLSFLVVKLSCSKCFGRKKTIAVTKNNKKQK